MSQIETHTPTRCKVIGLNMTAPAPVLSPISILPLLSSHYTFIPARKISGAYEEMLFYFIIFASH